MALIEWPGKLMMGIPCIDDQHMILISTANRLHDSLVRGSCDDDPVRVADEMQAYSEMHFADEMLYFDQYLPNSAKAHRGMHDEFAQRVSFFKSRLNTKEKASSTEMLFYLAAWLSRHIGLEDRKLALYASLARASPPARIYDPAKTDRIMSVD